jgi:glycerophosphoryl diester phosphodiesterase
MTKLAPSFLTTPLAHRALHDLEAGRPENSRAAMRAAMERGYGIELDVQLSADNQAMVFHDDDLGRLTARKGLVRQHDAATLAKIPLKGGDEGIPTLPEVLDLVAGKVPLLIEIKDQDGKLGRAVGELEQAVAKALKGYGGPVALMSFNPHSVAALAEAAPDVPRGLTTCNFSIANWRGIPRATLVRLRGIPDYDRVGASFISHQASDLKRARVSEIKAAGGAILCWTIRSPKAEAKARLVAGNVTFEGYLATLPGT